MADPEDFMGTPFVLGSIRGERCWNLNGGRLYSPAKWSLWTDGENVSDCRVDNFQHYKSVIRRLESDVYEGRYISEVEFQDASGRNVREVYRGSYGNGNNIKVSHYPTVRGEVVQVVVYWMLVTTNPVSYPIPNWNAEDLTMSTITTDREHWVVDRSQEYFDRYSIEEFEKMVDLVDHEFVHCTCGFYAYTNQNANEYSTGSDVIGVIEGYGETAIGTLGFRSHKAKILALAPTGRINWSNKTLIDLMIGDGSGSEPEAMRLADGRWILVSGRRSGKASLAKKKQELMYNLDTRIIQENYPGVKIFSSVDEMREAFPLDS